MGDNILKILLQLVKYIPHSTLKTSDFMFITFSMVFKHFFLQILGCLLHAIHKVRSQFSVVFTILNIKYLDNVEANRLCR